jgi:hypothetical protein
MWRHPEISWNIFWYVMYRIRANYDCWDTTSLQILGEVLGLKRKRFPFSRKANMMRKWANFREISFHENFRFPGSFRKNGYVSAINIFKMINSKGNLTILVHVHYCCPICFEAPSGFDILRYFKIFPVSCVRFLIHFRFHENFRYFRSFS